MFSLDSKVKSCGCGLCKGKYIDDMNAIFLGPAIPFAIDNYSLFSRAIGTSKLHEEMYDNIHGKFQVQCWLLAKGSPNWNTIRKVEPNSILGKRLLT